MPRVRATILFGTLVLLSGGCAPAPRPDPDAGMGTPAEVLAANRARWTAAGIDDYRMTVQPQCFCPPLRFTVEVRDGVPVSHAFDDPAEDARIGELNQERAAELDTVEELFAMVENALEPAPATLRAAYGEQGWPREFWVDVSEMMADEEHGFTVTDFQPL